MVTVVPPDGGQSIVMRPSRMAAVMADLGVVLRKLDLILSHFEYLKTQCG